LKELTSFVLSCGILNIGKERRSDVLERELKEGAITEVYFDDYFNTKISKNFKGNGKFFCLH
jgi:hypothetical protein